MTTDNDVEARLARQRLRGPRPGLRGEILACAARQQRRARPWFAYAVAATILLSLAVGQIADRLQSRQIAALTGIPPSAALADRRDGADPIGVAALLRQQAEIDSLLASAEWPGNGAGS